MERLRKLIKEVLSTPPKQDSCNCGCHSCENVGNPGVVLNESLVKKDILSENLRYHVVNKLPLTENTFRYGSQAFLNLWAEARSLYLREIIHVNDDDKEILTETDLGNYGVLENGERVPLDLPMEEWPEEVPSRYGDITFKLVKVMSDRAKYDLIDAETGKTWEGGGRIYNNPNQLYSDAENTIKPQGGRQSTYLGEAEKFKVIDTKTGDIIDSDLPKNIAQKLAKKKKEWTSYPDREESVIAKIAQTLDEAKDKPLNKPMRDSSGGKAYKVYVKDPKTKKIKTVRFGSGGLKAKINNPKARQAFAKRHNCAQKKDKTKAGYWSCRLPRYAKLLGLKSSFSGFW